LFISIPIKKLVLDLYTHLKQFNRYSITYIEIANHPMQAEIFPAYHLSQKKLKPIRYDPVNQ